MRPGLTCLWALNGRDAVDFETWMRLDLEYIDNWSLWLDLTAVAMILFAATGIALWVWLRGDRLGMVLLGTGTLLTLGTVIALVLSA